MSQWHDEVSEVGDTVSIQSVDLSTTLLLFIFFDLYIHITTEAPTSESITATSAPQTTSSAQEPTWSSTFSNYSAGFSSKVPPPTLISPAKATPRAGRVPSNFFYDEKGLRIKCRQPRHVYDLKPVYDPEEYPWLKEYNWKAYKTGRGGAIDAIQETLDRIPLSVKLASENGDFTWTWGSTRLDFTVPTRDLVPALSAPYFVEGPNGELEHTWDTTNGISSEFWSMATWNRRNPGQTEREWDHTSSESLDFWKTAHWNINRPKRRDLGVGENETGLDGNVDVNPQSDKLNAPSGVLNEGSD
ncbi:hypothetical protein TWF679_002010 [Orbilia oligospora]|uniref:Uncharacterized protein n=1 Tax=Orbilia oligospora TaxID=2813651 RepID=A0A8H8UUE1_ORBOL|nr:hypothetical protein TWF679_002010 [Orbilia oligospora]